MYPETVDNIRWVTAMALACLGCIVAVHGTATGAVETTEPADAVGSVSASEDIDVLSGNPAEAAAGEAGLSEVPYPPVAGNDSARLLDLPELDPDLAPPIARSYFDEVTLVFTGDNLLGAGMPRLIEKHGEDWPYAAVAEHLRGADLAFGNLESPITDYPHKTPGKSWESIQERRNFIFKAPPEYSGRILAAAGFDVVSLANNHAMDYCSDGMADTVTNLTAAGVAFAGAGLSATEAFQPVIVTRKGVRIGFIARSKIVPGASKAGDDSPGLAWHGTKYSAELAAAITGLRPRCDILVVTFHWGYEGHRRHAAYQQELAHRCIDDGADLVIGHHPHCLQGVELYNGGVIAYSLGNFLFTGASPVIESAILKVTVGRDGVRGVELLPCWVKGGKPEPSSDEKLLQRIKGICDPCGVQLTVGSDDWLTVQPKVE